MCARIYLNGDGMGRGTHISVFLLSCAVSMTRYSDKRSNLCDVSVQYVTVTFEKAIRKGSLRVSMTEMQTKNIHK